MHRWASQSMMKRTALPTTTMNYRCAAACEKRLTANRYAEGCFLCRRRIFFPWADVDKPHRNSSRSLTREGHFCGDRSPTQRHGRRTRKVSKINRNRRMSRKRPRKLPRITGGGIRSQHHAGLLADFHFHRHSRFCSISNRAKHRQKHRASQHTINPPSPIPKEQPRHPSSRIRAWQDS